VTRTSSRTAAPGSHPHEAHALRIDSTKARVKLGWRPQLPLDEAIAWTAEWYRGWSSGADVEDLCIKQIEKYLHDFYGQKHVLKVER